MQYTKKRMIEELDIWSNAKKIEENSPLFTELSDLLNSYNIRHVWAGALWTYHLCESAGLDVEPFEDYDVDVYVHSQDFQKLSGDFFNKGGFSVRTDIENDYGNLYKIRVSNLMINVMPTRSNQEDYLIENSVLVDVIGQELLIPSPSIVYSLLNSIDEQIGISNELLELKYFLDDCMVESSENQTTLFTTNYHLDKFFDL